jgi:hypothetical protein
MKSDNHKIYKIDNEVVTKEEAVADGIYSIYYLLDDNMNMVDRIEMINKGNIYKVVYPEQEMPFEGIINQHLKMYPSIDFELWDKKIPNDSGNFRYRSYLYNGSGECISIKNSIVDADDYLLREMELDATMQVKSILEYIYEERDLIKIIEFDKNNNKISEQNLAE